MVRKPREHTRAFTPEDIKTAVEMWNDYTADEIGARLNRPAHSIRYLIIQIRRAGFDLPKKTRSQYLQSLISRTLAKSVKIDVR